MGTLGSRIAYLRNGKRLSQPALAKYLKLSTSSIGMYEIDKREPPYEILIRISNFFEVSLDWLITGEEAKKVKNLTEDDKRILYLMNQLGDKGKDYVVDLLEKMASPSKD